MPVQLDGRTDRGLIGPDVGPDGHMAVAASRDGGLMARVDPEDSEKLLLREGVSRMVMGGRSMNGWLRVEEGHLGDEELAEWVDRGLDFARSLPAKSG